MGAALLSEECSSCVTMARAAHKGHAKCLANIHLESPHLLMRGGLDGLNGLDGPLAIAAHRGNIECLKYLFESGAVPVSDMKVAMSYALTSDHGTSVEYQLGQMEVLKYVHEGGAPWSPVSMELLARQGNVACIQYAHQQGVPVTETALWHAACFNHVACLEYMIENRVTVNASVFHIKRHRMSILGVRLKLRRTRVIQRAWREYVKMKHARAVKIIEDAFITWACRPGRGCWYQKSLTHFDMGRLC